MSPQTAEVVTISPKFQVVIPKRIREAMGLRSGEKISIFCYRDHIELIPLREIHQLRGALKGIDTSFVREGDQV
ncbi:MAG: AbrB family transcriptional regulator [Verrucomicrobia bacterium]|nr:MAG: AbrB family transcriptional regulator [Verrucomicrobiota bacterium]